MIVLEMIKERNNPNAKLKTVSMETKEILAELNRDYKQTETKKEVSKPQADKFNAVCLLILAFSFHLDKTAYFKIIYKYRHTILLVLLQLALHRQ